MNGALLPLSHKSPWSGAGILFDSEEQMCYPGNLYECSMSSSFATATGYGRPGVRFTAGPRDFSLLYIIQSVEE
jgi:hypothetical protein